MVTAIVLINVERSQLQSVIKAIKEMEGVTEVYAVAGEYDLVAIVRVKENATLSNIVVEKMPRNIPGITHSKTLFALESHSTINLNEAFSNPK